jgi:hypothetical protein
MDTQHFTVREGEGEGEGEEGSVKRACKNVGFDVGASRVI